jgi:hypothetical protein
MARRACLAGVLGLAMLSGCALRKLRYDDVVIPLAFSGQGKVAVAVSDERPYVLKGWKPPHFVGVSHGGIGNAFDVTTESRNPLAIDMTTALMRSLRAAGYETVPVFVTLGEPPAATAEKLKATGAQRAVLLALFEWETNTFVRTALLYDAALRVLDGSGQVLARSSVVGRDNLGKDNAEGAEAHAKQEVPPAFRGKVQLLLNDPQVVAALR